MFIRKIHRLIKKILLVNGAAAFVSTEIYFILFPPIFVLLCKYFSQCKHA